MVPDLGFMSNNVPASRNGSQKPATRPRLSKQMKRVMRLNGGPETAAAEAHLHYVNDGTPGISRKTAQSGDKAFVYHNPDGKRVRDAATLERIRKLAVPPAYQDVWICCDPDGHLQATGKDARGRRQYRYHARWREVRDEAKYGHLMVFAKVLPEIRRRVETDLSLPGLPRKKVLAAIVKLLETSLLRVGNEEYAQANKSFGITTLRNRHVKVKGTSITFDFRGKHGVNHHIDLRDARLARIVRKCQDLPGQVLFQFIDHENVSHSVGSADVNRYLKEISGADVTAKDFRTWAGTTLAALALQELGAATEPLPPKKSVLRVVEAVSKLLGNTPAICRKCYIHPAIFEGYLDGSLLLALKKRATEELAQGVDKLRPEEAAVTGFLAHRLMQAVEEAAPAISVKPPGNVGQKNAGKTRNVRAPAYQGSRIAVGASA